MWRALVEALLVHETYFFRHPDQLRLLAGDLLPRLVEDRRQAGSGALAVWCAGCSTGEEVYTVALLLHDAIARGAEAARGLRVSVLGTDVSGDALAAAQRASFAPAPGLDSFRDVPDFARRHFSGDPRRRHSDPRWSASSARRSRASCPMPRRSWSPAPDIRRCTRFLQHNLVSDPPPEGSFDLILCRNTPTSTSTTEPARRALLSLEAALRPGGVLLLGPAEMPREDSRLTVSFTERAVFWTKPGAAS